MIEDATEVVSEVMEAESYAESDSSPASRVSVSIGPSLDAAGFALLVDAVGSDLSCLVSADSDTPVFVDASLVAITELRHVACAVGPGSTSILGVAVRSLPLSAQRTSTW